jgi:SNF2 family DNA or RNA helicase
VRILANPSELQLKGASFLVRRKGGCLFFATGSGKTLIMILSAFKLLQENKVDKFIFVCTLSSKLEVFNDFKKFTDQTPVELDSYQQIEDFLTSSQKLAIIQYNRFPKHFCVEGKPINGISSQGNHLLSLLEKHRIGMAFDEVHMLKNPNAALTVFYKSVIRGLLKYCYGLTATGVMSKMYDLYHILDFCSPECLGSLQSFNDRFVIRCLRKIRLRGGRSRKIWEVMGIRDKHLLQKEMDKVSLSAYPDKDINFVSMAADLTDIKTYLKAAKGVLDDTSSVKQHSARLVGLQQVVNEDPAKKTLLINYLKERVSQGTLLYCAFYHSLEVVESTLKELKGVSYNIICGRQSAEERQASKDWFCKDPRNKVLLITRAGGQSLNLQACPNIAFFDGPFGIGYYIQIVGRVVREFSNFSKFNITFLILKDTIDEYKFEHIASNKDLFMRLFRNEMVPSSNLKESVSKYVLQRLRQSMLWKNDTLYSKHNRPKSRSAI